MTAPRLLVYTSLYPNPGQPVHGVFVANRLRELARRGGVQYQVVAPVARQAWQAPAPLVAAAGPGIEHPRFPVIPGLSASVNAVPMYLATRAAVDRAAAALPGDALVDAQYLYPDGVAGALHARRLGRPLVLTARGSDVNLWLDRHVAGAQIRWSVRRAAAVITVSDALRQGILDRGLRPRRIETIRNGVDLQQFRPGVTPALRDERVLLFVGALRALKGPDLAIRALAELPGQRLALVGSGPERARLEALARDLGIADRVLFAGAVEHAELPAWYASASALLLLSTHEGMPNVVLEAQACGVPVVATAVGGVPEVVDESAGAGRLVRERTVAAVVAAVRAVLAASATREQVRDQAGRFDWQRSIAAQVEVYRDAGQGG